MANISLPRDNNRVAVIGGVSSSDGSTPTTIYVDPTSHAVLVSSSGSSGLTVGTTTIASGTTTRILYDNAGVLGEYTISGTGNVAMTNSPTFVTPVLGAATATSINGNIFTTGSSTYTGTAAQTYTFPTTTATIARTDAAQTFTGTQTFSQVITTANTVTVASNAGTVPITSQTNNFTNSSASAMTITMATASAVDGQKSIVRIFDFTAVAKGITWVGTENSANTTVPSSSAGSTTIPLSVGFVFNGGTSKWTCIAYS